MEGGRGGGSPEGLKDPNLAQAAQEVGSGGGSWGRGWGVGLGQLYPISFFKMWYDSFPFFFFLKLIVLREGETEQVGEGQRERERESIPSRLRPASTEPNAGLELTNFEIMA